jgi:glutaredoxin
MASDSVVKTPGVSSAVGKETFCTTGASRSRISVVMTDTAFTPVVFLKAGCPFCLKVRLALLETGQLAVKCATMASDSVVKTPGVSSAVGKETFCTTGASRGCPFCLKVRLALLETGQLDQVVLREFAPGTEEETEMTSGPLR